MSRQYQIFGEAMVRVKFGSQVPLAAGATSTLSDLGLCEGPITINLNLYHEDVKIDNYGPRVPVDKLWQLGDASIEMNLVHWDSNILELCLRESEAGGAFPVSRIAPAGYFAPAGFPMGGAVQPHYDPTQPIASGYHFVSLNIVSTLAGALPWRFPASYLTENPATLPLGTKRSVGTLRWRAIPYNCSPLSEFTSVQISGGILGGGFQYTTPGEISSSGVLLWDHFLET